MAESKTAKKSSVKPDSTKFIPDPNCPRIVPLQENWVLLRHPISGRTIRMRRIDLGEMLTNGELASHPLASAMKHELNAIPLSVG